MTPRPELRCQLGELMPFHDRLLVVHFQSSTKHAKLTTRKNMLIPMSSVKYTFHYHSLPIKNTPANPLSDGLIHYTL